MSVNCLQRLRFISGQNRAMYTMNRYFFDIFHILIADDRKFSLRDAKCEVWMNDHCECKSDTVLFFYRLALGSRLVQINLNPFTCCVPTPM